MYIYAHHISYASTTSDTASPRSTADRSPTRASNRPLGRGGTRTSAAQNLPASSEGSTLVHTPAGRHTQAHTHTHVIDGRSSEGSALVHTPARKTHKRTRTHMPLMGIPLRAARWCTRLQEDTHKRTHTYAIHGHSSEGSTLVHTPAGRHTQAHTQVHY